MPKLIPPNYWKALLVISKHHKKSTIKKLATSLLGWCNTAGGPDLLREEYTLFIRKHWKEIPKQIRDESKKETSHN